jgi:hypothetical protein
MVLGHGIGFDDRQGTFNRHLQDSWKVKGKVKTQVPT